MAQPLSFKQRLAGNPSHKPHFSVTIQGESGALAVTDPRAIRGLVAVMDMHAVLGGAASHYGGPAAFAELNAATLALILERAEKAGRPWYDLFHWVNDAGHCENGLYALKANYHMAGLTFEKLMGFRSIESALSGHGEAHLFPAGVQISNGPLGSAFPQSQGLAMADAMTNAMTAKVNPGATARVTITAISDGACMEGEAREAMAAIPGLAQAGHLAPYVLIISDNNTKLSGRIDKDSFSMEPTFKSLATLGWEVIELSNGHDLQKCYDTIRKAVDAAMQNPKKPIAIHARTIKGIGTKKTAESSSGGHGFPLKGPSEMPAFVEEIYAGSTVPPEFHTWIEALKVRETDLKAKAAALRGNQVPTGAPAEKIQTGVSAAMIRTRKAGLPVVSITSDLPGSTGVAGFRKEFPEASIDVGIAESNMVSVAAGFSKLGYIPVVDTFAQFGVTKGALPHTMASLSEAPVIAIYSHTGFQDAADGASHQALSYLAMLSSIPHLRTVTLSCSEEADQLVAAAIEEFAREQKAGRIPQSTIFFLGRENFPRTFGAKNYALDQAQKLTEVAGQDPILLVAVGSMVGEALAAQEILAKKGRGSIVLHPSTVNVFDAKTYGELLKSCQKVVVVEDHQAIGGYGQFLAASLMNAGHRVAFRSLGVHGEFGQSAYNAIELYRKHGLDSDSIVKAALDL